MERPFAQLLGALLEQQGWEIQDLAEKTGLSRQTVSRHLNGHNFPHRATRKRYAAAFQMSVDEFDERWRRPAPAPIPAEPGLTGHPGFSRDLVYDRIPVFKGVHAGGPVDYESVGLHDGVADDYIPRMGSGVDDPSAFAVIVVGDSMTPEFQEGDTIVCSPDAPVEDGVVAFVRFGAERDNGCTLKRVYDDGNMLRLEPDNKRYSTLRCEKTEVVGMARVVAKWTRYL